MADGIVALSWQVILRLRGAADRDCREIADQVLVVQPQSEVQVVRRSVGIRRLQVPLETASQEAILQAGVIDQRFQPCAELGVNIAVGLDPERDRARSLVSLYLALPESRQFLSGCKQVRSMLDRVLSLSPPLGPGIIR